MHFFARVTENSRLNVALGDYVHMIYHHDPIASPALAEWRARKL